MSDGETSSKNVKQLAKQLNSQLQFAAPGVGKVPTRKPPRPPHDANPSTSTETASSSCRQSSTVDGENDDDALIQYDGGVSLRQRSVNQLAEAINSRSKRKDQQANVVTISPTTELSPSPVPVVNGIESARSETDTPTTTATEKPPAVSPVYNNNAGERPKSSKPRPLLPPKPKLSGAGQTPPATLPKPPKTPNSLPVTPAYGNSPVSLPNRTSSSSFNSSAKINFDVSIEFARSCDADSVSSYSSRSCATSAGETDTDTDANNSQDMTVDDETPTTDGPNRTLMDQDATITANRPDATGALRPVPTINRESPTSPPTTAGPPLPFGVTDRDRIVIQNIFQCVIAERKRRIEMGFAMIGQPHRSHQYLVGESLTGLLPYVLVSPSQEGSSEPTSSIPSDVGRYRDKPTRQQTNAVSDTLVTDSTCSSLPLNQDRTVSTVTTSTSSGVLDEDDERRIDSVNNNNIETHNSADQLTKQEARIKRLSRLTCAAQEILETEQKYVKHLRILGYTLPEQMKKTNAQLDRSIYEGDVVRHLQNAVSQILPIHERLLDGLKDYMKRWDAENPRLSPVINEIVPFLKCCQFFLLRKREFVDLLHEAWKESPVFAEFCRQFDKHYFAGLSMDMQLDVVHQRVMRYPMLLQNYQKFLEMDSDEYRSTSEVIRKTTEVAEKMNQAVDDSDMKRVFDAHRRLQNMFEVFKPGRRLIMEGAIQKQSRKDVQLRHLLLFTDYLLYCHSVVGTADLLKITRKLSLDRDHVRASQDEHSEFRTHFYVHSIGKSFEFIAKDMMTRNQWVDSINKAVRARQQMIGGRFDPTSNVGDTTSANLDAGNETTMCLSSSPNATTLSAQMPCGSSASTEENINSNIGNMAAVWVPDNNVSMCQCCDKKFSRFNRWRHHCRLCGKVICVQCTGKAPIRYLNWKTDKACIDCLPVYQRKLESLPSEAFLAFPWRRDHPAVTKMHGQFVAMLYISWPDDYNAQGNKPKKLSFGSGSGSFSRRSTVDNAEAVETASDITSRRGSDATRSTVQQTGKLKKWDVQRQKYNEFWAVLNEGSLELYRARKDNMPVERVPLFGFSYHEIESPSYLIFELRHVNQVTGQAAMTVRFKADDSKTADNWSDRIQECLEKLRTDFES